MSNQADHAVFRAAALTKLDSLVITIGVSSSALFDMRKANAVFVNEGEEAFMRHMRSRARKPLKAGAALSFVKKILALNGHGNIKVNVPILSRMNFFAQQRVQTSLEAHGLTSLVNGARDTPGAVYTKGRPITPKNLEAMGVDIFLTTHAADAQGALATGMAAAIVSAEPKTVSLSDKQNPGKIVVGYDFCRVLGVSYGLPDDPFKGDSEAYFKEVFDQTKDFLHSLSLYRVREASLAQYPAEPGPLTPFYLKMCAARDRLNLLPNDGQIPKIENRIITTRDMGALSRVPVTLGFWGAEPDHGASCGATSKAHYVDDVDFFLDDSERNIKAAQPFTLAAHVPWDDQTPRGKFMTPRFAQALAFSRRQKKELNAIRRGTPIFAAMPAQVAIKPPSVTLNDFYFSGASEKMPVDENSARIFVKAAREVGNRFSNDPSTKVGVLVWTPDYKLVAVGVNNFPEGVAMTEERLNDRAWKYPLVSHGEESAIHAIAKIPGASAQGNIIVLTGYSCHDCATAIANTGLTVLVGLEANEPSSLMKRWDASMRTFASVTLRESGTKVFPVVVGIDDPLEYEIDIVEELQRREINLRTGHAFDPPIPLSELPRRAARPAALAVA